MDLYLRRRELEVLLIKRRSLIEVNYDGFKDI
jgi:hypothetical protein